MKIVAVTACIVGLAHCKMSRKALVKQGRELGYEITCEVQGAMGIEHQLEQSDIDSADVVIFAADVAVTDERRFKGKKIYKTSPSKVLKNTVKELDAAIELINK